MANPIPLPTIGSLSSELDTLESFDFAKDSYFERLERIRSQIGEVEKNLQEYSAMNQALFHQLQKRLTTLDNLKGVEGLVSDEGVESARGPQVPLPQGELEEKGDGTFPDYSQLEGDAALARRLSISKEGKKDNATDGDEALARKLQTEEEAKMRRITANKDQCTII